MNFQDFISPAIISAAIGLTGWLVKNALNVTFKLLIAYIKSLLEKLEQTSVDIKVLDQKMGELTHTMATIPKLKADLDAYFGRLKSLEEKFDKHIDSKH